MGVNFQAPYFPILYSKYIHTWFEQTYGLVVAPWDHPVVGALCGCGHFPWASVVRNLPGAWFPHPLSFFSQLHAWLEQTSFSIIVGMDQEELHFYTSHAYLVLH